MPIEHATLTGAQLHEPKGVDSASANEVYVANGSGSGAWTDLYSGIYNRNKFCIQNYMIDIGATESIYFQVPTKSRMTKLHALLYGTLTGGANTVLTIYINGVLFADSLSFPNAGTGAGQRKTLDVTTIHTLNPGDVITVTSNGDATNSLRADVQIEFEAIA